MHSQAWQYLFRRLGALRYQDLDVLEFGSLNINGSCRELLPHARYYGIDLQPGPGVDEIADATTWQAGQLFDLVVCTEVFEHLCDWPQIVKNAAAHLTDTGWFIVTCASDGRAPHSAKDGHPLASDEVEWYENIGRPELEDALTAEGFTLYQIEQHPGDIYAIATRGPELPTEI